MPILKIQNKPLVEGQEFSVITSNAVTGDSTLNVQNADGFAVGKYLLIGNFGEEGSEIIRIHTTTPPTGTIITLNTTLVFSHTMNTRVTQIDYNQAEFSRATTVSGTKTTLTTKAIEADDLYTSYDDTTNATGYGFIRFKHSDDVTYSAYSGAIPYTGFTARSVYSMIKGGLNLTNESFSNLITHDFCLDELNNWQDEVSSVRNWDHESTSTTDTVVAGQKWYDVPTDLKHTFEDSAIIQMRVRNDPALRRLDKTEFDLLMENTISSTLAVAVALIDTTITLVDTSDFSDSGSIVINGDSIDYTSKDDSTNVLSGVTGITATHSIGDTVWQSSSLDKPVNFAVYNEQYALQPVAYDTYDGYAIYIDYYKTLDRLTDDADLTPIPFPHLAHYFLAWKIEEHKGDPNKKADKWRLLFENRLASLARKNRPVRRASFRINRPF